MTVTRTGASAAGRRPRMGALVADRVSINAWLAGTAAVHARPWVHVDSAMHDMPFLDHSAAYAYRPTEVGARPSPRHAHTFSSRDNSQRMHLHKLSRRSSRRVTPSRPAADPRDHGTGPDCMTPL